MDGLATDTREIVVRTSIALLHTLQGELTCMHLYSGIIPMPHDRCAMSNDNSESCVMIILEHFFGDSHENTHNLYSMHVCLHVHLITCTPYLTSWYTCANKLPSVVSGA